MFSTLSGFSIFFFSVAAILLAGILFEEKFLQLEDKIDAHFKKRKQEKRQRQIREFRTQNKNFRPCENNNSRARRNFAA